VGVLSLVKEAERLVELQFETTTTLPTGRADPKAFRMEIAQLREYFAGERVGFDIPLDLRGTPFQRAVWAGLLAIPFGETRSYSQLARAIGRPRAVRAVGAANGRNPIGLVVPCHRVIGASGALVGFGGGLRVKRWLLAHEARRHDTLKTAEAAR
jgi:methylated-DNA-[protein]-cysteine S-methyltransferase